MTNTKVRKMIFIALCVCLMAICSWIAIPAPVPFTLQTFAVFGITLVLKGKEATKVVLLYIFMGAVGIPVFAGMSGGFFHILAPTGGYLVGFLFIPLMAWAFEHTKISGLKKKIIPLIIGLILCYAAGTAWFIAMLSDKSSLGAVLMLCVVPYVVPDILKLLLAVVVSKRIRIDFFLALNDRKG